MSRLPDHRSQGINGPLREWSRIPHLRSRNLIVHDLELSGDAPKRFVSLYRYEPGGEVRRDKRSSWPRYIAKTAEKWHPIEGVTEYLINRIGQAIGLPMNEVLLRQHRGSIWFLSRYFLRDNGDDALLHGTEVCGDYLQDHDFAKHIADDAREARELFTFEFIEEAIKARFPLMAEVLLEDLVRMLTFDCLLGNNDRHFYNWGVIYSTRRRIARRLAPIYDSSRGLFWSVRDKKLRAQSTGRGGLDAAVERYATRTYPRMTCESNHKANHFDLIEHIVRVRPAYNLLCQTLASEDNEAIAKAVVREEVGPLFSPLRIEAITKLLTLRFEKTRQALA